MKTSEVLIEARKLIADEANWIKGQSEAEVYGQTCFCSVGAVSRAAGHRPPVFSPAVGVLNEVAGENVILFNDDEKTTHADVLAVFDEAIRKAQQAEARALWVEALRDGTREQTKSQLRRKASGGDGFCCLGVACEVAVERGVILDYDSTRGGLPHEVQAWLGIDYGGTVTITHENYGSTMDLTVLNDAYGYSFTEIADLIEEGVLITQ